MAGGSFGSYRDSRPPPVQRNNIMGIVVGPNHYNGVVRRPDRMATLSSILNSGPNKIFRLRLVYSSSGTTVLGEAFRINQLKNIVR